MHSWLNSLHKFILLKETIINYINVNGSIVKYIHVCAKADKIEIARKMKNK